MKRKAYDIGFEEYISENTWCLIEWPQKIKNLLPLNSLKIEIKIQQDQKRQIIIKHEQL